jgi:hypothetical protein
MQSSIEQKKLNIFWLSMQLAQCPHLLAAKTVGMATSLFSLVYPFYAGRVFAFNGYQESPHYS